jgi:hypothetical protein
MTEILILSPHPSPLGDCVVIEGRQKKTEQTAGFQNFRMRTFKCQREWSWSQESQFFHYLETREVHGKGCALKLSHPSVCPVFFKVSDVYSNCDTASRGRGEGWGAFWILDIG